MNLQGQHDSSSSPGSTAAVVDGAAANPFHGADDVSTQERASWVCRVIDRRREVAAGILVLMMLGMLFDSAPAPEVPPDPAVEFESIDDLFADLDASLPNDPPPRAVQPNPSAAATETEPQTPHRNASWSPEAPAPPLTVPATSPPSPIQPQGNPLRIPGQTVPPSGKPAEKASPPIRFSGEIRFGT